MTDYGGFQIAEPLHDDGLIRTYEAIRDGEGGGRAKYQLRLFQPPDAILGTPRAALDVSHFLETARRLQEASQQSSWLVEVLSLGRHENGAFLVTSSLPHSLQTLIDTKVHLSANQLRRLIGQVIQALYEYQTKTGCAHGNLDATTVLIDTLSDFDKARIRLTDPALNADGGTEADLLDDQHALGRLIHALVESRPAWAPVRWPVPAADPWKELGRSGEKWRELTNLLLDPHAEEKGESFDLAQLDRALPVEPRDLRKPAWTVGVATLLMLTGGILYKQFIYNPRLDLEGIADMLANIELISGAHTDWLSDFRTAVEEPQPLATYLEHPDLQDPDLQAIVTTMRQDILEPLRSAIGADGGDPIPFFQSEEYFTGIFTEARFIPWTAVYQYVMDEEKNNDWIMENLRENEANQIQRVADIITATRDQFRTWKQARLEFQLALLDSMAWENVRNDLSLAVGPADESPEFQDITVLLDTEAHLAKIRTLWETVDAIAREADGRGANVLSRFQSTYRQHLAALGAVELIRDDLEINRDLVSRLLDIARDEGREIEWDLYEQSVPAPSTFSLSAFRDWSDSLQDYYRFASTMPLDEAAYVNDLDALNTFIGNLRDCAADQDATDYQGRHDNIVAQHDLVRTLPYIRKHQARLEQAERDLATLDELRSECELLVARVCEPPAEYYGRVTNLAYGSPSLAAAWAQTIVDAAPLRTMPEDGTPDQLREYLRIRKPIDGVQRVFDHLDRIAFRAPGTDVRENEYIVLPDATSGWARDRAVQVVRQRREQAIEAVLASTRQAPTPISLDSPGIARELDLQEEQFALWQTQTRQLVDDYLSIERHLDLAFGLDELDPAANRSIASIEAQWTDSASENYSHYRMFEDAFTGINTRLDMLRTIRDAPTSQALQTHLADHAVYERPEMYFAAWSRLEELLTSRTHQRLADDHEILRQLNGWLGTLDDSSSRLFTLRDRLSTEAHRRWVGHMSLRSAPREDAEEALLLAYEEDLNRRIDFAVRIDELSEWMRWNIQLHEFRDGMRKLEAKEDHENDARNAIASFQRTFTGYDATMGRLPDEQLLRDTLELIRLDEQKTVDFDTIGPASGDLEFIYDKSAEVPNQANASGPPSQIVYRYNRARQRSRHIELRFILLDHRTHERLKSPVYISAEEFSLKTFKHIAGRVPHTSHLEPVLNLKAGADDPRKGPRIWWTSPAAPGQLLPVPVPTWLIPDTKRDADYPAGGGPRRLPTEEHPMQYLSPIASMYLASTLGCRIPTTNEFQAALEEAYGTTDLQPVLTQRSGTALPNLRDRRYKIQYDYAQSVYQANTRILPFTPDKDSFDDFTGQSNPAQVFQIDDGRLWFDLVNESGDELLHHLFGNLMEWVYDQPEDFQTEEGDPPPTPPDLLRGIDINQIGVIGGSALSAPDHPAGQRQAIKPPLQQADLLRYEHSDVGFRLVIAGKFDTVAQQVLEATKSGYADPAP